MLPDTEGEGCTRDATDVFKGREGVKSMDQNYGKMISGQETVWQYDDGH